MTERLFGLGVGLFVAAAILSKGQNAKSAVIGLIGAVIVLASTIASIIIQRRQVAETRVSNKKILEQ